jgi:hypothetical protein
VQCPKATAATLACSYAASAGTKHHRRRRATIPDFHACRASPPDIDDSYAPTRNLAPVSCCAGNKGAGSH